MQAFVPLQPGCVYRLYNRGNNREDLLRGERDYQHFLELYARHLFPVIDTYAYCLMRNHFYVLVRVKHEQEWWASLAPEYWVWSSFGSLMGSAPTKDCGIDQGRFRVKAKCRTAP